MRNNLEQSPKKLLRESIKYLSFGRGAFETARNRASRGREGTKHPPKKKRERKWRAMATTTSTLTTQSTRS